MAATRRAPRRAKSPARIKLPKPKTAKPRTTRSATGSTTTTRSRRGRAKAGLRSVKRSHTKSTPTFGSPRGKRSTTRSATAKTRGGLKRTAKVSKSTTGTGAGRVTKTRRVITRVKNGRTVKRVVTRVNRGGKVTVNRSAPKVSGRGPQSTRPTHRPVAARKPVNPGVRHMPGTAPAASPQRSGGTSAPRAAAFKRPAAPKRVAPKPKKRRR